MSRLADRAHTLDKVTHSIVAAAVTDIKLLDRVCKNTSCIVTRASNERLSEQKRNTAARHSRHTAVRRHLRRNTAGGRRRQPPPQPPPPQPPPTP